MYLLKTFSICFDWNRPLIMSCELPSTDPLVPNSAKRKSRRCFGCLQKMSLLQWNMNACISLPVKCFTNFREISKRSFLCANTKNLRRSHNEFWLTTCRHIWILLENNFKYAIEKFIVGIIAIRTKP